MPDKMGIIGNTQGVKASNKPKPKKLIKVRKKESCCNDATIRSCSDSGFDVELLFNNLSFNVPLARNNTAEHEITLTAKFQGCAERGVCYPPMQKTVNLLLPVSSTAEYHS
jgi:thiol:disulfide interchange protein